MQDPRLPGGFDVPVLPASWNRVGQAPELEPAPPPTPAAERPVLDRSSQERTSHPQSVLCHRGKGVALDWGGCVLWMGVSIRAVWTEMQHGEGGCRWWWMRITNILSNTEKAFSERGAVRWSIKDGETEFKKETHFYVCTTHAHLTCIAKEKTAFKHVGDGAYEWQWQEGQSASLWVTFKSLLAERSDRVLPLGFHFLEARDASGDRRPDWFQGDVPIRFVQKRLLGSGGGGEGEGSWGVRRTGKRAGISVRSAKQS